MKTFQEFKELLLAQLEHKLGEGYRLTLHKVIKNNQVELDGLCIMPVGESVAPTIYLNDHYNDFLEGAGIGQIADNILALYRSCPHLSPVNLQLFQNFSLIREKIAYKLIHFQKNVRMLKEVPHIPFLDLAIVFYCILDQSSQNHASFLIRNEHLAAWKISDQTLYETAIRNTPTLLPADFNSMTAVIQDFCDLEEETPEDCKMYVLTNSRRTFGAACILYENMLKDIADRFRSSLYILPSSIHEVILIPTDDRAKIKAFSQMVCEVNDSQLLAEEILSDHAYYYDIKKQAILCG